MLRQFTRSHANLSLPRLGVALLLLSTCATGSPAADEEPGDKAQRTFLQVRDQPNSQELNAAAIKVYTEAEEEIEKYAQAAEEGKLKSLKLLPLGQAVVKINQLNRLAERLMLSGEPAGHDLFRRISPLRAKIFAVLEQYRKVKGVENQIAKGMTVLQKESEKRLKKALPLIDKLLAEQKYDEADQEALANLDALDAMGVYYAPENRPYRDLVYKQNKQVWEAHVRKLVIDRANEQIRAAREAGQPDFDGLVKRLQDAATAVGATGRADVAGESLAGPAVIARLGVDWKDAQLAAVRCQALEWGMVALNVGSVDTKKLLADQGRFDQEMRRGLASLIEADAGRASASEAEALYPLYVGELAELAARSGDPTFVVTLQGALDKLAARSPALAAEVATYRAATEELLRWRQRTARAQAAAQGATFPKLDDVLLQAAANDAGRIGLDTRRGTLSFAPAMARDVPEVFSLVGPHLSDKTVAVSNVSGSNTAESGAASFCAGPAYATLGPLVAPATAIARLEQDLLVGGSAEPLTLEAAVALATARRGDYESVGGQVASFTLEAAVPRFSTLQAADWNLVRLAPLPVLKSEADFAVRVVLRAELTPAWIQHSCYFVDLRPAAALTQTGGSR